MNIEMFPLDKVVIDSVPICLGMERTEVEAKLGEGETFDQKRFYYYKSELSINYDSENKVEFIEFLGGINGKLHPVIYGVSAFDTKAGELYEILKQKNNGDIDDSEHGYSYGFLNISVGVYRELIPDDIDDMIEDAEEEGEELDEEDLEYERRKANYWATIGIGVAGYYR